MPMSVDGPLLCVITKAYHLNVFLSLANLNIQEIVKHSNSRRCKRVGADSLVVSALTYSTTVLMAT